MVTPTNERPSVFVGRELELNVLKDALKSAIARKTVQAVLVQGDYGTGKSTLVRRFLTDMSSANPSWLVGHGMCVKPSGEATPDTKEAPGDLALAPFLRLFASLQYEAAQRKLFSESVIDFVKDVAPAWLNLLTGGILEPSIKTVQGVHKILAPEQHIEAKKTDEGDLIKDAVPSWLNLLTGGILDPSLKTVQGLRKLIAPEKYTDENVRGQFVNILRRFAQREPVIAFIDDLQWADKLSLELFFYLIRAFQEEPAAHTIFFVVAFRPVETFELSANAKLFGEIRANLLRYGVVELELHKGLDAGQYVKGRYPSNTFPSNFVAYIQQRTEGHPLFLSQLFSLWEEQGLVTSVTTPQGDRSWGLRSGLNDYPDIPLAGGKSLRKVIGEILLQRLRILDPELRDILKVTSVEGEDFTAQVIMNLRKLDVFKAFQDLSVLDDRYRLIHQESPDEAAEAEPQLVSDDLIFDFYRFVHRLFRELIYSELDDGLRRVLHEQVGECLEMLLGQTEGIRKMSLQLARHFDEARQPLKAAGYALLAAQYEESRYAWEAANQWCQFGLERLKTLHPTTRVMQLQFELWKHSGDCYQRGGDYTGSEQQYLLALEVSTQTEIDPVKIADLHCELSDIYEFENQYEKAQEYITQGRQLLEEHHIPFGAVHIKLEWDEAFLRYRAGDTESAAESYQKTIDAADKLPQTNEIQILKSQLYNALAIALSTLNRYAEAVSAWQKSIRLAEKAERKLTGLSSLLNLADNYVERHMLDEGEKSANDALAMANTVGDQDNLAYAHATLGKVHLSRGMFDKAHEELIKAIAISERANSFWNMGWMLSDLALAYLGMKNPDEAYQQGLRSVVEAGDDNEALGCALDALGQVETSRGDFQSAIRHLDRAITVFEREENEHFAMRTQRHLAEAKLQAGGTKDLEDVDALLEAARETFERLNLEYELAETRRVIEIAASCE